MHPRLLLLTTLFLGGCCIPPLGGGGGGVGGTGPAGGPPGGPIVPIPTPPAYVPPPVTGPGGAVVDPGGVCRTSRRLEERAGRNEAAQIDGAYELFGELAGGAVDPVVGGVLVCDLRLPGTPWYKSRPDMLARVQLAGGPEALLPGRDNRDEVVVTMPLTSLKSGDAIRISVEDRDLFNKNDPLDSATGTYAGVFPWLGVGGGKDLHVICQRQDRATTEAETNARLPGATAAVDAYDTAAQTVDRDAPDWGEPAELRDTAEAEVETLAARIGWTDTRVAQLRQRLVSIGAGFDAAAAADVQAVAGGATPKGTAVGAPGGDLDVTVVAVHCGTQADTAVSAFGGDPALAPSCVLELKTVTRTGAPQLPPIYDVGTDLTLAGGATPEAVLPDGRTAALTTVAHLSVGAQLTWLLGADDLCHDFNRKLLQDAVLIRLTRPGQSRFLGL